MKRVLMVAEKFPPFNVSGSARPFYFAKYLPEFGYQPLVLSSRILPTEDRDDALLGELPECVRVVRTPRLLFPLAVRLRQLGKRRAAATARSPAAPSLPRQPGTLGSLVKHLGWWLHWDVDWSAGAILAGRHVSKGAPPELIWASGPHFRNLAAAARIASALGKPLVADLRDPWTYGSLWSPKTAEIARAERRWAERVLAQAARVVFTSPLTLAAMHARFPNLPRENWRVITNGYDDETVEPLRGVPDDQCLFRYIGSLNERRYPDSLIRGFELSCRDPSFKASAALEFIGNAGPHAHKAELAPGCAVRFHGPVSRRDSVRYMFGSDVNVLLQTINEGQDVVSGKAFDYLHAGKPILAVVDPSGGDAWLMRESGAGRVVDWSEPAAISAAFDACFAAFRAGVRRLPGSAATRYGRRALTAELAQLFDQVLGRGPISGGSRGG